jgi:hypothetical protein
MEKLPGSQNSFIAYLFIILGFFVLLFFTRGIYTDMQTSQDTREILQNTYNSQEQKLSELNTIQTTLSQEWSQEKKQIQWFIGDFSEANILEYMYSYAQRVNLTNERMIIRDINIIESGVSDIWFDTANITLSAVFSSEDTMFAFLNYLVSDAATYKFYIENFEYPMNNVSWNVQVSIPLTFYYKK